LLTPKSQAANPASKPVKKLRVDLTRHDICHDQYEQWSSSVTVYSASIVNSQQTLQQDLYYICNRHELHTCSEQSQVLGELMQEHPAWLASHWMLSWAAACQLLLCLSQTLAAASWLTSAKYKPAA